MMILLSEIISVFILIQKEGHFSCLFTRIFYIIHCMCKNKHVFTLLCKLNIYTIWHLFPTDNRDPKGCHQNILSKLKQSRYCIILIVSSDASINVSQISMFRDCKNYNSELATPPLFYNNTTIMLIGQNMGHM